MDVELLTKLEEAKYETIQLFKTEDSNEFERDSLQFIKDRCADLIIDANSNNHNYDVMQLHTDLLKLVVSNPVFFKDMDTEIEKIFQSCSAYVCMKEEMESIKKSEEFRIINGYNISEQTFQKMIELTKESKNKNIEFGMNLYLNENDVIEHGTIYTGTDKSVSIPKDEYQKFGWSRNIGLFHTHPSYGKGIDNNKMTKELQYVSHYSYADLMTSANRKEEFSAIGISECQIIAFYIKKQDEKLNQEYDIAAKSIYELQEKMKGIIYHNDYQDVVEKINNRYFDRYFVRI